MRRIRAACLLASLTIGCSIASDQAEVIGCTYVPAKGASPFPELSYFESCAVDTGDGEIVVMEEHLANLSYGPDGLASLLAGGRYYYVKEDGDSVAVVTFDNGADRFSEGFARTVRDGKTGFIDKEFRLVIPPLYDWAWPFESGVALVCIGCRAQEPGKDGHRGLDGGAWGYINRDGEEVVPVVHGRDDVPTPPLEELLPAESLESAD